MNDDHYREIRAEAIALLTAAHGENLDAIKTVLLDKNLEDIPGLITALVDISLLTLNINVMLMNKVYGEDISVQELIQNLAVINYGS